MLTNKIVWKWGLFWKNNLRGGKIRKIYSKRTATAGDWSDKTPVHPKVLLDKD